MSGKELWTVRAQVGGKTSFIVSVRSRSLTFRSRSSSARIQRNADVLGQDTLKCSAFDGFVSCCFFFFCFVTESMCVSTKSGASFTAGITLSPALWFQRVKVSSRTD